MNSEHLWLRTRGGIVAIMVCLCGLAFVEPCKVRAQTGGDNEAQTTEYRELIEQALSEFKHKNWPEARVLFRRAHELSPSARTQRGIGMVSYEMRDYVTAVVALSSALVDQRQALTEQQRKECDALLTRSRTFVGAYTLKLEPAQADITLDGTQLAHDLEGRALVPFGEHTLRAVAPGYQDSTSKLAVQGGEQGELRIVLYKPEAVATARPAASVEKVVTSEVSAPGPTTSRAPAEHQGFIGHGIRYSWITLGATAAFGAAAAGVWYRGQGKVDDLDDGCARAAQARAPCSRGNVDTDGVSRHERASSALLGLSAASLVATGVLLALEWPSESRTRRAQASGLQKLAIGVSPQRLSVRGSF